MPKQLYCAEKGQDVPEGAVRYSTTEVLTHHMEVVHSSTSKNLWPLKYGTAVSSLSACASGFLLNMHFRRRFKLQHFGRMSTILPVVCLPGMMSGLFHQFMVTNKILMGEAECSVCMGLRSASGNVLLGLFYPMVISPISCIIIARKYYTVSVPSLQEGTHLLKFLGKKMPILASMGFLFATQFALGMIIAEREVTAFNRFLVKTYKISEFEEEVI